MRWGHPTPAAEASATVRLGRADLDDRRPHVHRLSNGHYTVLITNAGGGRSESDGIALTRWQSDPVEDGEGFVVYLRDLEAGRFWSLGYQPTAGEPERYQVDSRRIGPNSSEPRRASWPP